MAWSCDDDLSKTRPYSEYCNVILLDENSWDSSTSNSWVLNLWKYGLISLSSSFNKDKTLSFEFSSTTKEIFLSSIILKLVDLISLSFKNFFSEDSLLCNFCIFTG